VPRLTAEEIASRRLGMGSTDVVEVALSTRGMVPWKGASPMRVYCRKRGILPESTESTAEQEWGHVQEAVLLGWYERDQGATVLPGGRITHPIEPWLWATLDARVLGGQRNVEAKNVGRWMTHGWNDADDAGIPHHVRAQVVIGQACSGGRSTDVVASIGGMPPRIWRIEYDVELADMLIEAGRKFWTDHVLAEVPPELDDTSATRAYLDAKYPCEVTKETRDATPEEIELGNSLARVRQSASHAKTQSEVLYAQLLERVGDAGGLHCRDWKITWRTNKNGARVPRFTERGEE
jgi:predicted phage-related endonuclease